MPSGPLASASSGKSALDSPSPAGINYASTWRMDVGNWLRKPELEQYEAAFRQNAVDADILAHLTAEDLKNLGNSSFVVLCCAVGSTPRIGAISSTPIRRRGGRGARVRIAAPGRVDIPALSRRGARSGARAASCARTHSRDDRGDELIDDGLSHVARFSPDGDKIMRLHAQSAVIEERFRLCARGGALARRFPRRADGVPRRPPRRPGRLDRAGAGLGEATRTGGAGVLGRIHGAADGGGFRS